MIKQIRDQLSNPKGFSFNCFKYLFYYKNKLTKIAFCAGILSFMTVSIFFGHLYKNALNSIDVFKRNNLLSLDRNFMTEKTIGMYFKYHTQICEYDGWRPPIHEPALVIGQWLNGRKDPLNPDGQNAINLKKRIELYRKFFRIKKLSSTVVAQQITPQNTIKPYYLVDPSTMFPMVRV